MYILHETDIPYVVADRQTNQLKVKLHIEESIIEKIYILYGDSYDYKDFREQGWNYFQQEMKLRYQLEGLEIWEAEIPVLKWKRMKYSFLLVDREGKKGLYNEYGYIIDNEKEIERLLNNYYSHFFYPYVHDIDMIRYPAWAQQTIWYQIFPERFCRGKSQSKKHVQAWRDQNVDRTSFYGGNIDGIISKLDYLEALGVNGLYLTPVFAAPTNHKYDTVDYFTVDPDFGSNETLKELVHKAHERGIKVILDGVFNHISSRHPFWLDVLEKQEDSDYKDFFCIREYPVEDFGGNSKELSYETFSFVGSMPKLNYENEKVKKYVLSIIKFWIEECDIDGWRFDVGNELSFDFYNELRTEVKAIKDDIYIIAEIWHDANRWLRNGYIDGTMNYSLCSAISDYAVGNHLDGKQFNQRYFRLLNKLSAIHSKMSFNLLDSHDTERIMTKAGGDKMKVKNAFLMMFLFPGSPCIYYGTEVGMEGENDPDNRRPMIWDGDKIDQELLLFFKELIRFRKEHIGFVQNAGVRFEQRQKLNIWKFSYDDTGYNLIHNLSDKRWKNGEKNPVLTTSEQAYLLEPGSMALFENENKKEKRW